MTRSGRAPKTVFPDTNGLLHFQWLGHIDWLHLLELPRIEIVLAPVVIAELDKHKYGASKKLRERARAILSKLDALMSGTEPYEVRANVGLCLLTQEPSLNYSSYGLDPQVQDDRLIASILAFRADHPDLDVAILTNDFGLRLKARDHRIDIVNLPETYRLPDEADPLELKVRHLEEELQRWRNRAPDLKLTFEDATKLKRFEFAGPVQSSPEEFAARMEELRKKYPLLEKEPPAVSSIPESLRRLRLDLAMVFAYERPSDSEIERYNKELGEFFAKSAEYWKAWPQYEDLRRRTFELRFLLYNDGTAPADNITVLLHLPDGVTVFAKNKRPRIPEPPEPPTGPRSRRELLLPPFPLAGGPQILRSLRDIGPPPNVTGPSIKRTKSVEVAFAIAKLSHLFDEKLGPLYVVFDSISSVRSFGIDYRVYCESLPGLLEGRLDVAIEPKGHNAS